MSGPENEIEKLAADGRGASNLLKTESVNRPDNIREVVRELVISEIQKVALETRTVGNRSKEQNAAIKNFTDSVDQELKTFGKEIGDILSILPQYQAEVTAMVKEALRVHVVGFIRAHGLHMDGGVFDPRHDNDLSDDERRARRAYVQEFTSMLLENLSTTNQDVSATVNLSKYHPPEYVRSLLDGSLIRKTLEERKFDMSNWNMNKINIVFPPYVRIEFARGRPKSIPDVIARVAKNFDEISPEAILERVNLHLAKTNQSWTMDRVKDVFSQAVRAKLADSYASSIFDSVIRIVDNINMLPDTEIIRLAHEVGVEIAPDKAASTVAQHERDYYCLNFSDPRQAIQRWLKGELKIAGRQWRPNKPRGKYTKRAKS